MDFKIDFNIDFSDNEFEKYLANPTKFIEDAKARMRKEAYERANAELEATRQKAVALAKIQSELNAYQQELKVEIDQYKKSETQKLIASVGNSPAPRAESQVPSPPQIESPKIANPQPSNPKATPQKASSQKPQEDKSKPDNTAKPQRASKRDKVSFEDVLEPGGTAPYSRNKERMRTKGKPTLAERIQASHKAIAEEQEELKKEMERSARNTMWDAIFAQTNNEFSSNNVYEILHSGEQVDDDKALGDAIRTALDNGIKYETLVDLTHDQMENKLGDAYDAKIIQDYLDRIYNEYTAPGADKQTSYNHPADEHEPANPDTQQALKEMDDMNIGGF